MTVLDDIPTDSRGFIRRGLDWIAGWVPLGLGSAALLWLFSRSGGEDSFMSQIEGIPIIGSIARGISSLFSRGRDAVSRMFNREGYEAEQGMRRRIDNNQAFEQVARDIGGSAEDQRNFTISLREVVRSALGGSVTTDEAAAAERAIALRTAIHDHIVQYQNRVNPNLSRDPSSAERAPHEDLASRYAIAISGAEAAQAAHINPNTATGVLGMGFQTARVVAAPADFQASQTAALTIEVAQAAAAAAPANVTVAPETGAPTTAPPPAAPVRRQG